MEYDTHPSFGQSISLPPLAENHLCDLRRSGLSDQQITACGFHSISDPREAADILRWRGSQCLGTCLVIPYRRPDGALVSVREFARLKPDVPRTVSRDGKARTVKYEAPRGLANRLYFPPGACAKLTDTSIPMIITEGEKKSARTDQAGFVSIAISGVECWSKKRETGPDGKKIGKRELLPDFDAIALHGRAVFIVFDSDIRRKGAVRRAANGLARALRERGAIVSIVRLPDGPQDSTGQPTKVGLDDYLITSTAADLQKLLDDAVAQSVLPIADDRTVIQLSTCEADVNDDVIGALSQSNQLFQRGGRLVHVVNERSHDGIRRPEHALRILPLPLAALREELTRWCQFAMTVDGETKRKHPPKWCYEAIAARGTWPAEIRPLAGIVTAPVLRQDGSLLTTCRLYTTPTSTPPPRHEICARV